MFYRVLESDEGKSILQRYESLYKNLNEKQRVLFLEWAKAVPKYVDVGLNMSLLKRDQVTSLTVNFDQKLFAVLKEVNYLKQMCHDDIPKEALNVSSNITVYLWFHKGL